MDPAQILDRVVARFIGTKHERDVKKLQPSVAAINEQEAEVKALSDDELKAARDPGADALYNMHSSNVPAKANGYRGGNYANYKNPRSDQLLDQQR